MQSSPSLMRFSTTDLPQQERATILREVFGRGICNMEITPLTETPEVEAVLRTMPGLSVTWGANSPHRFETTRDLNRGSDEIIMGMFERPLRISHRGQEIDLDNGSVLMMSAEQVASAECASAFRHTTLRFQRQTLARLIPSPGDALMRPLPADREALQLLKSYLAVLQDNDVAWSAGIERAIVTHIYDLVALAVGTTRDIAEQIKMRGVRAARLEGIKRIVLKRLGNQNLSVTQVAAAQRVTPRYVQMLFESEGTTFSAFVLGERLALAHRMLSDPRYSGSPIGTIALDAGFGDLSYFNRVFRRTYGGTPTDVRNRVMTKVARG